MVDSATIDVMRVTSRDPAAAPLDLPTTAGVTFKLLWNNEFITQGGAVFSPDPEARIEHPPPCT